MNNFVGGSGPNKCKLMLVGNFPVESDIENGGPFNGKAGEFLDGLFEDLNHGNWRNEFYTTNVYKYRPPENDIARIKEVCNVTEQIDLLWNEIETIKPNCIIAFGETALKVLTQCDKILIYRGSILQNCKHGIPKVIPTIHPSNLVRVSYDSGDYNEDAKPFPYIYRLIMMSDIQRAIEESEYGEYKLPQRLLRVARNSADVFRFIQNNRQSSRVYADIETFRSTLPVCISIAFDKYESLSIPLFQKAGTVELTSQPSSDIAYSWQFLDKLFRELFVAGQNFKFDQAKLEMIGFRFKGLISDIGLKAHTINPELPNKSQAFLASIYTREPYYKDEGKEFHYGKHKIDRLFLYNAKDSAVCAEIDEELEKELIELSDEYHTDLVGFYYNYVIKLHQFYFDLEKVGFKVDEYQIRFLLDKYEDWRERLTEELYIQVGHPFNVNSPKQVAEILYGEMDCPRLYGKSGTGEDVLSLLLADKIRDIPRRSTIQNILELRRVNKTLSTYINCGRDYDGKLRSQYRIIGTETGRSSTAAIDEPVRPYEQGFAFQTLTKHGDIGQDIRSYLIPEEGFIFVNVDLSQAEARVVALLSEDYELLDAFNHIDIHRRMAACALITGRLNLKHEYDPVADIIGKDSPERFIGKKSKHATNYDMKWKRFQSEITSDARRFKIDLTISPFKAKQILERIHAASPKTKDVFHRDIIECIDRNRTLINPFGRIRRFYERASDSLYQEAYATIPQSTVIDRLRQSALEMKKIKAPVKAHRLFCGESHDALLMQLPIGEYTDICKEYKKIMETEIDFSACSLPRGKLIIPCDFEIGENYKDFEKLKI